MCLLLQVCSLPGSCRFSHHSCCRPIMDLPRIWSPESSPPLSVPVYFFHYFILFWIVIELGEASCKARNKRKILEHQEGWFLCYLSSIQNNVKQHVDITQASFSSLFTLLWEVLGGWAKVLPAAYRLSYRSLLQELFPLLILPLGRTQYSGRVKGKQQTSIIAG